MTSKRLGNRRGSALIVALFIAILILLVGVGLITRNVQQSRLAKKSFNESRSLVTAHSFAALLKQDLLTNYQAYLDSANAAWAPCRKAGAVNADSFMHLLSEPGNATYVGDASTCPDVAFSSDFFVPLSAATFKLRDLKTTKLKPKNEYQINDFTFETSLADFNLDALRNSVSSPSLLSTIQKTDAPISKNLRLVIDIRRTLAAATGANCGICRTVPGAVCCGSTINLAYLEAGSGRVMNVVFNEGGGTVVSLDEATPNRYETALSIKNMDTTPTPYNEGNFCIGAIQGTTALRYLVDGAIDDSGTEHYLTSYGDILNGTSGNVEASDPKIISIAYDKVWYLLRSDGQVMKSTDITQVASYNPIPGFVLQTAQALAVGRGPTTACTP